jgi:dihydrofolate synthase/folylpolyglutamate synthase
MPSRFQSLDEWLRWQETLHPSVIDLGLERCGRVWRRMQSPRLAPTVVTITGTNGKGSCANLLAAIYGNAGYAVGLYTSPHLLRYNERIRIRGREISDKELVNAFAAVDAARGDESLTYFEFGTLAAFWLFARSALDVVILEVGLGGRLDATNLVDADIALITSIGLDHQQWLGTTREQIAAEKAGILRPGRSAICGDVQPPSNLLQIAAKLESPLYCIGRDFAAQPQVGGWDWSGGGQTYRQLPLPRLRGAAQLRNAASVLMAVHCLAERLPISRAAIEQGLSTAALPGRQQVIEGRPRVILDVAHNTEAVAELAEVLRESTAQGSTVRNHLVFAVLNDKPAAAMVELLAPHADAWYLAAADTERALSATELQELVRPLSKPGGGTAQIHAYSDIAQAFTAAMRAARPEDRIIVTGSFWTVAGVMAHHYREGL